MIEGWDKLGDGIKGHTSAKCMELDGFSQGMGKDPGILVQNKW